MVEQGTFNSEVAGSNPVGDIFCDHGLMVMTSRFQRDSTGSIPVGRSNILVAQLDRAMGFYPMRCRFESYQGCHSGNRCIIALIRRMMKVKVLLSLPLQWGCSSVGRTFALQAKGRGFKSHQLHH